MTKRVAAIGECMVEVAPAEAAGLHQISFAGDTFNTAWYLKRLQPEFDVDFVTRVGRDDASEQMVRFLSDAGLGIDHIARADDRTVGLYMISLDGGERSFSYWRGQSAAKDLAKDGDALERACSGADLVYFSGITLGILDDPGRNTLLEAAKRARSNGATVAFDSNLRPKLWPDLETMCASVMEAAKVADLVLPSHDDEATYFGDADPQATLARYQSAGASSVVVKNGPGEILFAEGSSNGRLTPSPVTQIVDTTAAGDSFNAGIFGGLLAGRGLADAVAEASALSAQVIGGRGALVDVA